MAAVVSECIPEPLRHTTRKLTLSHPLPSPSAPLPLPAPPSLPPHHDVDGGQAQQHVVGGQQGGHVGVHADGGVVQGGFGQLLGAKGLVPLGVLVPGRRGRLAPR